MTPIVPPAQSFDAFFQILAMVSDPESAKARLAELRAAADEARQLIAEASAARAEIDAKRREADTALAQARSEHDAKVASDREAARAETLRRENALLARESRLQELEAAAQADRDEAAKLKSDLQRRVEAISRAAAG